MRYFPTKLFTAGFALTGIAIVLAIINAICAICGLCKGGRNGYTSTHWVRASSVLAIVYLAFFLGRDIRPRLQLPLHALGGDETFAQLAAFANLFGYIASATILQTQFKLAFDLFSIRDKFAHQVATAFFSLSLALSLAWFISTQVWEHVRSSSDGPGLHPSAYANNVLEFLLSFVLFLASVTTVIPNTRGGPRATGANDTLTSKWASDFLLAANVLTLIRQTWMVVTNGIDAIPMLIDKPHPRYPPYFFLIAMIFDVWIMAVVVTLLFFSARFGLRGREQMEERRPVSLERYSETREHLG
ncbi:unnamed protein product [Clonostachys rosea]|uniref:Uncharacterized protein n=1 Tax=Bionectria ochroleuca TaxID=29856 RepID=A0ABY6UFR3_BIOOC|nr:unnamed protein product [Clonostachys rosea]